MHKGSVLFVYIKLFLTAVFWGGTFIAGRIVANDVGPFAASFLRFATASIFLLFITLKIEGKIPILKKGHIIPIILLGMSGVFAYNVFFFKGLKIIEAGRASLIIANNPIFITLFSSYFFKEKLNVVKVTGIIISVIGAIIVISRGNFLDLLNGSVGWGEFYIFCCVLTWVTYTLIGKAIMKDLSPFIPVFYSSVVGAVALFAPAYFEGMMGDWVHYDTADWFGIFYLGFFGTALGFVWYYQGIKIIGPMKAGQFINFVPISAVVLSFFILGEPITLSLFIGAIFVISGVYLTNR